MTKRDAQAMRIKIDAALAKLSKETGFALSIGNITFDNTGFRTKLTAVDTAAVPAFTGLEGDARGAGLAAGLEHFRIVYGLKDEVKVGYKFAFNGKAFILKGMKPKNRAYPVIADCVAGGSYKLPLSALGARRL